MITQSVHLAAVRRLEAVSFRSFPTGRTIYDGAWALRLSDDYPAKRVNSLNPLDPGDRRELSVRIDRAEAVFEEAGRPLVLRASPLCPPQLHEILDQRGWSRFDESRVMVADLDGQKLTDAQERMPLQDTARFVRGCAALGSIAETAVDGLCRIIGDVEGTTALFLAEDKSGAPQAAAMAVRFMDLVGLFEIAVDQNARRKGHGRSLLRSAMHWGQAHGARQAWLQVQVDNEAACRLYESEGFADLYRYYYRKAR